MSTLPAEVETLHFEHILWSNELKFFADELSIFEGRLEKLVQTLTDRDMLARLEHYQNQFIRQKEVLDQLKHDIKVHDQELGRMLRRDKNPDEVDNVRHAKVDEDMRMFRKIYAELKSEFYQFMADNL